MQTPAKPRPARPDPLAAVLGDCFLAILQARRAREAAATAHPASPTQPGKTPRPAGNHRSDQSSA